MVLLLFAILLMGGAGYRAVSMEAVQSLQASETNLALAVARGGLDWFVGSHRGHVPDSTTYNINGGTAIITARKVATLSVEEDLYLIRSEGTYTDPRFPSIPATRVVSRYATLDLRPASFLAPVQTTAGRTRVQYNGRVYGNDIAGFGSCPSAVNDTLAAVVTRNSFQTRYGGAVVGNPAGVTLGSFAAVVDSVDTAWDVYSDPTYPVDFEDVWPNFYSLPSDTFPVIRINGNFSPNWSRWGRGVLIVTGSLNINNWTWWSWSGIIIAGDMTDIDRYSYATIYGALISGQGSQMGNWDIEGGNLYYHSCYIEEAGKSIAHFVPMDNSWWEEEG